MGQEKLRRARVLAVGMGGIGCASTPWLVRAGVGALVLVDPAEVDEPDLGRQLLYGPLDLGRRKVEAARDALHRMNPHVSVEGVPVALDASNIGILARGADLILDGTDQEDPRAAMNQYGVNGALPVVFGGAAAWAGQVFTLVPGGPCRACAFPHPPTVPDCDATGIIGPVVGWVGAIQAIEVIRILAGLGPADTGQLQTLDSLHGVNRRVRVRRNPHCHICGDRG